MAFESVDVEALTSVISSCKNAIKYNQISKIKTEIMNEQIWHASARDNLNRALDNLVNLRYKNLENNLDLCSNIALMIGKYKELDAEVKEREKDIENLKAQLNDELTEEVAKTIKGRIHVLESANELSKLELDRMESQINSMV